MQFLVDLLPVIAFFVAYKLAGIYVATGVLIVGVLLQTAVSWLRHRKVSGMLLTSAVLVLVFGGLTLVFALAQGVWIARKSEASGAPEAK